MTNITAEYIVELFEKDVRARKRLAELLVSEPDVRLALINAVLRDVATKQDLVVFREEFRGELKELREYVDRRFTELKEYVDRRFEHLENEIREIRSEIRELRARLWWVVVTVVMGWLSVILVQLVSVLTR